jgi:hypothetical protein
MLKKHRADGRILMASELDVTGSFNMPTSIPAGNAVNMILMCTFRMSPLITTWQLKKQ